MKCRMGIFVALVLVLLTAGAGAAESQWVNSITVDEYNMTWDYTESFSGNDSIIFRAYIDSEFGNNDSFVNAWELLNADKEIRKKFQSSIDKEFDVRINNESTGIQVVDIDSTLSPGIIGNIHSADAVVNRYNVSYRWKDSIFNASSIWFLGQAKSPVTVILPVGMDVTNISGINNLTKIISDHVEITGAFRGVSQNVSENRGEITLNLAKNTSFVVQPSLANVTNATSPAGEKVTKPLTEVASKTRGASVLGAGIVIILLIYVFKVRKR